MSRTGNYIIACGGTGGHLAPGIALAEGLVNRHHSVTLLISNKKVDTRLVEKYPAMRFLKVPGSGFSLNPVAFVRFAVNFIRGFLFGVSLVRRERPDAIVGFGGFTTAGVILAGYCYGVPIVLHEANRVPGRAIRFMGPMARRVYLPPGVRLPDARQSVLRSMSLPVRSEILRESRESACQKFGLDPKHPVISVLGGSQGATPLNDWVRKNAEVLAQQGVQIYCVTGMGKGETETRMFPDRSGGQVKVVYSPFCDQMSALLSASDLVVSRAGAGTIAELIRCVTPAILIPFPQAADNHQVANARFFEQQGGGIVVEQTRIKDLTKETLELVFNDWLLRKFRENLVRMDRAHSLDEMIDDIEHLSVHLVPTSTEDKKS